MSAKEEHITLEEAKRQVYLVSRRLGLLHLAFAETLVEEFGLERGKLLTARAIKAYSRKIGEKKRAAALQRGIELTPQGFDQMSDLPSIGMHTVYEDAEVEGERRFRAFGCAMGEVWRQEGREDLGRQHLHPTVQGFLLQRRPINNQVISSLLQKSASLPLFRLLIENP